MDSPNSGIAGLRDRIRGKHDSSASAASTTTSSVSSDPVAAIWNMDLKNVDGLVPDFPPTPLEWLLQEARVLRKRILSFGNEVTFLRFFLFLVGWTALSIAGMYVVTTYRNMEEESVKEKLLSQAKLFAFHFEHALQSATGGMYTMDYMIRNVSQSPWADMPALISNCPVRAGKESYRDLAGIDLTEQAQHLSGILNLIKTYTPGVLNFQLAPRAVVSVIFPSNEDTIGHDLLRDREHIPSALRAIESGSYVVEGPMVLEENGTETLIGRLPVFVEAGTPGAIPKSEIERLAGHEVSIPAIHSGQDMWGFAIVHVKFSTMLACSGLKKASKEQNIVYRMRCDSGPLPTVE